MQEQSAVTTFLFTDIEGSTRLWEEQPERMRSALVRHDALSRTAVERRGGLVVKMTGDGIHAAFGDPLDAVVAALEIQQALAQDEAGGEVAIRVRCGMHMGVVERRDNDFFGSAVNRAARIMSVAHGGQVLMSQPVADLVSSRLPQGMTLKSLGSVRLRDLAQPERLHQVVHPALRAEFPALRSLEAIPNNLPQQVTSFVGREREFAEIRSLLRRVRLLTVVGTGGLGKTRISLQVAADIIDDFPDGLWLVELAAIADPRLVPQAVAATLSVAEEAGRSLQDALFAHLRERRMLILLDNCEHLSQACAVFARQLLQVAPGVQVLATSREPLHVAGETTYALPALALPQPPAASMRSDEAKRFIEHAIAGSEAARLFIDRALAVQPSFAVTADNAAAISVICRRVDGIPLALELAAARVRALSVDMIAARLDDRFRLLTGGDRTALPRQKTLRALIDWSYDLLAADECALFRRLSVFAGSFTVEAAEAVGEGSDVAAADVLDVLARLVDKSLVEREAAGERYRLLETMRQYAQERLDASGETGEVRERHLRFHLALAEDARPRLLGAEQASLFARLDAERENFLAAHAWCDRAPEGGELGMRLASALRRYWIFRGLLGLGYRITLEALARPSAQAQTLLRADALFDAGQVASYMGRYVEAERHLGQSLAISRGFDDATRIAAVLQPLGLTALGRSDFVRAREYLQEALQLAEKLNSPLEVAAALNALAQVARAEGDLATAEPLYERVLALARELGYREGVAVSLLNLAMVAIGRTAPARARTMLIDVASIVEEIGSRPVGQSLLEVAAGFAAFRGEAERAARLFGAVEAQAAETGLRRDPADEAFLAPFIARARDALGAAAFDAAAAGGAALGREDAIADVRAWLEAAAQH